MEIGRYIIPRPKEYLILFLKEEVIWIAILKKEKDSDTYDGQYNITTYISSHSMHSRCQIKHLSRAYGAYRICEGCI